MITYSSLSVIKFSPGISIVSIALPSNVSIVEVTRTDSREAVGEVFP